MWAANVAATGLTTGLCTTLSTYTAGARAPCNAAQSASGIGTKAG